MQVKATSDERRNSVTARVAKAAKAAKGKKNEATCFLSAKDRSNNES